VTHPAPLIAATISAGDPPAARNEERVFNSDTQRGKRKLKRDE
jgi:hypothetical protein